MKILLIAMIAIVLLGWIGAEKRRRRLLEDFLPVIRELAT